MTKVFKKVFYTVAMCVLVAALAEAVFAKDTDLLKWYVDENITAFDYKDLASKAFAAIVMAAIAQIMVTVAGLMNCVHESIEKAA